MPKRQVRAARALARGSTDAWPNQARVQRDQNSARKMGGGPCLYCARAGRNGAAGDVDLCTREVCTTPQHSRSDGGSVSS